MNRQRWAAGTLVLALVCFGLTGASRARAAEPLEVLYLTDYSGFWHDYTEQAESLINALEQRANVRITLVGKQQADTLSTLEIQSFAAGYDAVVYNLCLPSEDRLERVRNLIDETTQRGVPAVLLHCAAHSFRATSPSVTLEGNWFGGVQLSRREAAWQAAHPTLAFPSWWQFLGINSVRHDLARALEVDKVLDHPITAGLPSRFRTPRDELYRVERALDDLEVLYSVEGEPVAWTRQAGAAPIFVTTLGHDSQTLSLEPYLALVTRGLLWVTGRLGSDGSVAPGYAGNVAVDNYQGTVRCLPSDVISPSNVSEVQAAVLRARREGKRIKAISVPASNSNSRFICPEQGGILLNLANMNRVRGLDRAAQTVSVEPGVRMEDLSRFLHEHGYAVTTMPDYTGVSVAGGMATGAHNSSLRFANAIADLAVSMTVVDGLGRVRVLTGAALAASAVHLGLLGVVVEVTLQVVPQFKLRYGHASGTDRGLEEHILSDVAAHDYAKVMWFAGNGRYVLDYYDRVALDTPGRSQHNLWSSTAGVFNLVGDTPYRLLNALPQRAQCDVELLRANVWLAPIDARESPKSAPVGFSHEILASSCEPGKCPWNGKNVQSRTMEIAFPVSQLKDWMRDVRAILAKNRGCFPVLGLYLRFSKASDRALGLHYGVDTVSFEIHVPKDATETTYERSSAVYDEIQQLTLTKYLGRPHWGKNSPPVFAGLGSAQYPAWDAFLAQKRALDPEGLFENEQWHQLRDGAPALPYAGCALSRTCVCEANLDCGSGYRCEPGGAFTSARVCR